MYAQEYLDLDGMQWLVIDFMDSLVYVEPRKMSGYVFGELIISYFSYMSRFGYKNVYLFADLPVQNEDDIFHSHPAFQVYMELKIPRFAKNAMNEDYIFHIHPAFQVYKKADSFIRSYGSVFANGQRDGVISRIQKFKETPALKKYKIPSDLIPFDGDLWTRIMKAIEDCLEKDQKEQNVKFE